MSNAILRLNADIVAEWFVAGKTKDDAKALLKLPERLEVNDLAMSSDGKHVAVNLEVPELPESAEQISLPEIEATFSKAQSEDGQWHLPDSYKLVGLKATIMLPTSKEA